MSSPSWHKSLSSASLPPRTDAGNAELFAAMYRDDVRFDHARRRWLIWRGHWWAEDTDGAIHRLAKKAVRRRYKLALHVGDPDERKRQASWAVTSESRQKLDAMLALAQSERNLAQDGSGWDSHPWLLGVANGVIDLRTGRLRDGKQPDRITIHTEVVFDPAARCPRWERFVGEVFDGNGELVGYVHRAAGYSLTGDTSEQVLFLGHGDGANGKTTLFKTLLRVAGGYGWNLPFSALELYARAAVPNDLAHLVGRRLATASETSEAVKLNEQRVKLLTGEDTVTARFLYRDFFNFRPVAKFWLAFNHKPEIIDDSHGFWRRIRLIPFERKFTGDEVDKHLYQKLQAEQSGILNWMVQGALAWQRDGLGLPAIVEAATAAYHAEVDPLATFLEEECVIHPQACVTAGNLWPAYLAWAKDNAEDRHSVLDRRSFTRRLEARGFQKRRAGHARDWTWFGICRRLEASAQGIPVEQRRVEGEARAYTM